MLQFSKKIVCMLTAILVLATFTGCEEAEKNNVALVIGNTSNSASVDVSTTLADYITLSASSNASISFIQADGAPTLYYSTIVPEIPNNYSASKQESILSGYVSTLSSVVQSMTPTTPEVNLVDSLVLAGRTLAAQAGENTNEYIVVVHSGLSTLGSIDFTQGLLQMDDAAIADFIAYLVAENEVVDLSGVDVIWYSLGDTTAPQDSLSQNDRATLQAIWQAYLEAAGANSITFKQDVSSATSAATDLPWVTPVDVSTTTYSYDYTQTIVFDETSSIAFEANSDVLVDEDAALAGLAEIIEYACANPSYTIILAGTTAKVGDEASSISLSLARAQAICELMVSQGVDESQLIPMGLGYNNTFYQPDFDASSGNLIESAASTNRAVIIIPYTGQTEADFLL